MSISHSLFAGIGLHLVEFLSEDIHPPPKKNKADAGTEGYSLKPDSRAPLTSTQLTEHESVELVPACNLHHMF